MASGPRCGKWPEKYTPNAIEMPLKKGRNENAGSLAGDTPVMSAE